MTYFWAVLHFLTSFPYPRRSVFLEEVVQGIVFFPIAGFFIGLFLAGTSCLLDLIFPVMVSRALLLVIWVGITGALHLDGLADTLDGLGGGADRETRLAIMRDSRVGTYGMVGVVLYLVLKFAALFSIPSFHILPALIVAPLLGRLAMVLILVSSPYARPEGLGKPFAEGISPIKGIWAVGIAILLGIWWVGWHFAVYLGVALVAVLLLRRYFLTTLGGITGDTTGAVNELVEVGTLLVFLIMP